MKTIGIVGTRRRDSEADYEAVKNGLRKFHVQQGRLLNAAESTLGQEWGDALVSGGCPKGADKFAEWIRDEYGYPLTIYYPDRTKLNPVLLKKNPRAAHAVINYARNALIARDADVLIACVGPDRKGGTEDTIKKFCKKMMRSEQQLLREGRLILV